jgi:hypothetical protein
LEGATQAWFATAVNYSRRCFITLETALSEQWVEDKNMKLKKWSPRREFLGTKAPTSRNGGPIKNWIVKIFSKKDKKTRIFFSMSSC